MLVPLCTSGNIVPLNNFWNALYIYHDRPHIINRKLIGCATTYVYKIDYHSPSNKLTDVINYISLTYETNKLLEINKESLRDVVKNLLQPYDKNVQIKETDLHTVKTQISGVFITIRILYPSNARSVNCVEISVIDKDCNCVLFLASSVKDKFTLLAPPFPYNFEYTNCGHVKLVLDVEDADTPSGEWLADKLFPKIMKWAEEYDETLVNQQSLSLLPIERYCSLYKELKEKYGQKMIKIWPENTDPLKFVYEDVAIATYLICLWEITNVNNKPSFVDLGCGNGLLVYILSQEGYPGLGIDIRKRKIWDLYPDSVKLEVQTIVPSESSLFPTADWIIGNHSDELTPWIPVIAARSSMNTNFFVLPCCSFDFNGSKYIRKNPNRSQYNEYMEYIEELSKKCGFHVKVDKMRIPSTKRICIVSYNRTYQKDEYEDVNKNITNIINERCGVNTNQTNWVKDFQPRDSNEKVRNCTRLNKDLISNIIATVVGELLKTSTNLRKSDGVEWNAGGKLLLPQLVSIIGRDVLKQLKNECGGLQTLLKNHRYIFEVVQGSVKLRIPPLLADTQKYKDKPCWFLKNHPNGCLNDSNTCAYSHGIV